MKKIVIAASYFGINLGDEAILEAIIKSIYHIRKDIKITVLAWDVKKVREFHYDLFQDSSELLFHSVTLLDLRFVL